MPGDPFRIDDLPHSPMTRAAVKAARPFLDRLLGLHRCRAEYRKLEPSSRRPFADRVLDALEIRTVCRQQDLQLIPPDGPLIVAANHPHGAVDGLLLLSLLERVRPDVRLLANRLLDRFDDLKPLCFFVDPFEGPGAADRSRAGLRAAHLWLRGGGAVVIFPAGEVAYRLRRNGVCQDAEWKTTIGRLALATRARVVPAFIEGRNSRLFYAAGRIHPAIRTAMLARELLGKRGARIAVRLGSPLKAADLTGPVPTVRGTTGAIRGFVDQLAAERDPGRGPSAILSLETTSAIRRELAALPATSRLVEAGPFEVFCTSADAIPTTLPEIGRLRELTYRAVGEGTGKELDLDRFDRHYLHLFCWDREASQIVGAYRIGRTDRIVAEQGVDGLYTRTLFAFDRAFVDRLSPALELGRSFVRAEYQRHSNALMLLWKGIGRFVARQPQYRVLLGPVSISARYSDASHGLLMAFLEQNHLEASVAELVKALNPRSVSAPLPSHVVVPRTVDEADRLIARLEQDGKSLPVLLRQYLKLNARLIGFNVDPDFGDALDALMMVDLPRVDPAILRRYLGSHAAAAYLARHKQAAAGSAAA